MGLLIDGLRQMYSRDEELLERGIVLFEAMYSAFAGELNSSDPSAERKEDGVGAAAVLGWSVRG